MVVSLIQMHRTKVIEGKGQDTFVLIAQVLYEEPRHIILKILEVSKCAVPSPSADPNFLSAVNAQKPYACSALVSNCWID